MSSDYPSDWDTRRKRVYQRDNYKCQNCGRDGGTTGSVELHAHHVVPKANGGTHEKSNLITVCKKCHQSIHGNKTAPSSQQDSISNIDLPNQIDDVVDYKKFLRSYGKLIGAGQGLSKLEQLKQVFAQDVYFAYQHDDNISHEIKSDILNMKSTLSNSNYTHDNKDVQQSMRSAMSEQIKSLGMLMDYINGITQYHELTKSTLCPNCESKQDATDQFCGNCGENLPVIWECPECNTGLDTLNNDFCTSCGAEVPDFPDEQKQKLESIKQETMEKWNKLDDMFAESMKTALSAHPKLSM